MFFRRRTSSEADIAGGPARAFPGIMRRDFAPALSRLLKAGWWFFEPEPLAKHVSLGARYNAGDQVKGAIDSRKSRVKSRNQGRPLRPAKRGTAGRLAPRGHPRSCRSSSRSW
jgi:hypothetical protein